MESSGWGQVACRGRLQKLSPTTVGTLRRRCRSPPPGMVRGLCSVTANQLWAYCGGVGGEEGEGLTRSGGRCCLVSPSATGSDPRLRGAAGRHCQHLRGLLREQDVSDPQREAHAPQGITVVTHPRSWASPFTSFLFKIFF